MTDESYPEGKLWLSALRNVLREFMLQIANNEDDFTVSVDAFRTLYNGAKKLAETDPFFASSHTLEIVNRLASLAMVDPAILNPKKSRRAAHIQDVAVQRVSAIIHVMAAHEQDANQQQESAV